MNRLFIIAAAAVLVLALGDRAANAQTTGQYSCIISNGQKCYVYFDAAGVPIDTVCNEGSTGLGTFRGSDVKPSGPVDAQLIPTSIVATLQDPTRGTITTTLDQERQSAPTIIRSADSGTRYPLDVRISFFATATVGSLPGQVFRSDSQLVFTSSRVTSVNPFNAESLVLANNVQFSDANGQPAFTLQGGNTKVTLGVREPRPEYSCLLINGRKCYVHYGANGNPIDTVCQENGVGVGTFQSLTGRLPAQGTVNAELLPIDITATIADSTSGTITTRLDPTRPSSVTTIRSADGVNRFPLDVNIRFFATAALDSKPGSLFRSRTQLVFASSGVRSLNPFRGEVATLRSDVEFYDVNDPLEQTAFKLQGGRTTVTLGTSRPPGPEYNCILINGRKCYVYYDENGNPIDTVCDQGSKGIGTFRSLSGALSVDSAVNAVLLPVGISASVNDPTRGTITTSLDPSRQSSPTTIRSVEANRRFPLAVDISFFATASVESAPGRVYKSRTQLVFANNNVNSLNPFKNEVVKLKSNVEFYDAADPDERTAFTLQANTTQITLTNGLSAVGKDGSIELKLDLK